MKIKRKIYALIDNDYLSFLSRKLGNKIQCFYKNSSSRPHIMIVLNHQEYLVPFSSSVYDKNGELRTDSVFRRILPNKRSYINFAKMFPVARGMYEEFHLNETRMDSLDRFLDLQEFVDERFSGLISLAEIIYAKKMGYLPPYSPNAQDTLQDFQHMEEILECYVRMHNDKIPKPAKQQSDVYGDLGFKIAIPKMVEKKDINAKPLKEYRIVKRPEIIFRYADKKVGRQTGE